MQRRTLITAFTSAAASAILLARAPLAFAHDISAQVVEKLDRDSEFWKPKLGKAAYRVLFFEATERPHSSPLNQEKRSGTFVCAACYLPLFKSEWKYESGTGWPSFFRTIDQHVGTKTDWKIGLPRKEYHCARCGGHQGHVFRDGPRPTGKRYCNNGVALSFIPDEEPLPELRG